MTCEVARRSRLAVRGADLQTRSEVAGISMCSGLDRIEVVPPSPPPRRPSGCEVEGTSLISFVNDGSMSARGRA
jgi:hypothetical protein